jgi:AcrR family transcriptional regulator
MKRKNPQVRYKEIINAGITLAEGMPLHEITREKVADQAGCAVSLINHYFGTVQDLKDAIIKKGVSTNNSKLIAAGFIANSKHVRNLSKGKRMAAINSFFRR